MAFDEICANFITLSKNRNRIKKKKIKKFFKENISKLILQDLPFKLTNGQLHALNEINTDLKSDEKMFRVLQGDVGSGKTIVAMLSLANIIESKYQCALMSPTEILARQHYQLAKKFSKNKNINIDYISGKTEPKEKKANFKKT